MRRLPKFFSFSSFSLLFLNSLFELLIYKCYTYKYFANFAILLFLRKYFIHIILRKLCKFLILFFLQNCCFSYFLRKSCKFRAFFAFFCSIYLIFRNKLHSFTFEWILFFAQFQIEIVALECHFPCLSE